MTFIDRLAEVRPGRRHELPGPFGLPVIGQTLKFMHGDSNYGQFLHDNYGPVCRTTMFGMRMVNALGPDAVGDVLANRDRAYASGPGWSKIIGPFFNRGIMLLDFEEHHQHRRILQHAFTKQRLETYLRELNPAIAASIADWQDSPSFRMYPQVKQVTLDVATRTFMDGTLGGDADKVNTAFADCVRAGTAYIRFPVPGLRWSRGLRGRQYLERYLTPQIPAKRAGNGEDLFSALCHSVSEDGERFSDADVVNHMIFLLMAAHDTATITLSTMAYYLAKYPEWHQRCRAESLAWESDALDYDQLEALTSLDLVMKESLRLVSPVPVVMRQTIKDTQLAGRTVPKDSLVMVHLQLSHTMEQYWSDPQAFDPERFGNRREDKVHRHAFEPFGGGVHKCIGMFFAGIEVKAAMHQILRNFSWSVDAGYEMPIDWTSLPRPKDGLPVRLTRLAS